MAALRTRAQINLHTLIQIWWLRHLVFRLVTAPLLSQKYFVMWSKKKSLLSVFASEPEQSAVLVSCSVWLSLHDLSWSETRAGPLLRPVTITWETGRLLWYGICLLQIIPATSLPHSLWENCVMVTAISYIDIWPYNLSFPIIHWINKNENKVSIYSCKMHWCSQIIDIAGLEIWFEIVKETNPCKMMNVFWTLVW